MTGAEKRAEAKKREEALQKKIEEYEKLGGEYFFCDVEDDPPSQTLTPKDVDYAYRTFRFRFHGFFAAIAESILVRAVKKKMQITVQGGEKLAKVRGGAVFISNHFSKFENVAVILAHRCAPGRKRLYKVVREGNFFMPGLIGWLLKYCRTLPLSSDPATMKLFNKAVYDLLKGGEHLLIYPEQSMWHNYKKPRPYRVGAFHFAAKCTVPVVPCFVTLHEKDPAKPLDDDNVRYVIHVGDPLYPDENATVRENEAEMMRRAGEFARATYESVYGKAP